jgi:hypothetical protein
MPFSPAAAMSQARPMCLAANVHPSGKRNVCLPPTADIQPNVHFRPTADVKTERRASTERENWMPT